MICWDHELQQEIYGEDQIGEREDDLKMGTPGVFPGHDVTLPKAGRRPVIQANEASRTSIIP